MADEFKLGPSLLRLGQDCVPLDWREALLGHIDGSSASSFAASSKGAHDWLLQDCPEATLHFRVQGGDAAGTRLPGRFRRAQEQLNQRGARPTTFALLQSGTLSAGWWQAALADVPASPAPPTLTLTVQLQHIPAPLLARLGALFPSIIRVTLGTPQGQRGSIVQLPDPHSLPDVRELVIDSVNLDAAAELWGSVAPFLPHLVTLRITEQPAMGHAEREAMCTALFGPATLSRTLTRLTLPCALAPWLTALLQQYAPSIECLTVIMVDAEAGGADDVAPQCSWRTLQISCLEPFPAGAWPWLPVPKEGKLTIRFDNDIFGSTKNLDESPHIVDVSVQLTDQVIRKLACVEIDEYSHVQLLAEGVPVAEQVLALQTTLPHVIQMFDTDDPPGLVLLGFTMTEALAAVLAPLARDWYDLSFHELTWPSDVTLTTALPPLESLGITHTLDDNMLAKLVTTLTTVEYEMYVPKVELQSTVPQDARVPFKTVRVRSISVPELIDNATKLGGGVKWECEELIICVGATQVASVPGWVEQLLHIQVTYIDAVTIQAHGDAGVQEDIMLRTSLALIKALPCQPHKLTFSHWHASCNVIKEFVALQDMGTVLAKVYTLCFSLRSPTYDSEEQYLHCAHMVDLPGLIKDLPAVREWVIKRNGMSFDEVCALVINAPADRTFERPLTILVQGAHQSEIAQYSALLQGPHVTVDGHIVA